MKSMNELSSAVAINPQRVDPVPSFRSIVFCFVFVFSVCSILNGFSYPAGFDNKKFVFFSLFFSFCPEIRFGLTKPRAVVLGPLGFRGWFSFFLSLFFSSLPRGNKHEVHEKEDGTKATEETEEKIIRPKLNGGP